MFRKTTWDSDFSMWIVGFKNGFKRGCRLPIVFVQDIQMCLWELFRRPAELILKQLGYHSAKFCWKTPSLWWGNQRRTLESSAWSMGSPNNWRLQHPLSHFRNLLLGWHMALTSKKPRGHMNFINSHKVSSLIFHPFSHLCSSFKPHFPIISSSWEPSTKSLRSASGELSLCLHHLLPWDPPQHGQQRDLSGRMRGEVLRPDGDSGRVRTKHRKPLTTVDRCR